MPDVTIENSSEEEPLVGRSLAGKKILVIEDDNFLQGMLSNKISALDGAPSVASDGESGLTAAREIHPDIILLDLLLPGIGGFDVLTALKQDPLLKDIPVFILSNLGVDEDVERGLTLGAAAFYTKANFSPDEIFEKIFQLLE